VGRYPPGFKPWLSHLFWIFLENLRCTHACALGGTARFPCNGGQKASLSLLCVCTNVYVVWCEFEAYGLVERPALAYRALRPCLAVWPCGIPAVLPRILGSPAASHKKRIRIKSEEIYLFLFLLLYCLYSRAHHLFTTNKIKKSQIDHQHIDNICSRTFHIFLIIK
jgi:hypothetical protein